MTALRSRLRFWLARLAAAPRHSEVEGEAIRRVDELTRKLKSEQEREARHGKH